MEEFNVAAVFSDHMVLQRNKNIKVFGWGKDNSIVTVSFRGFTVETKVRQERWMAVLPPMEAGLGYEMSISCNDKVITFRDIAIGEVWLAGGQSNMEFELQNCTGGEDVLHKDINPQVRFYYTPKNAYQDEHFYETESASSWEVFGDKGTKAWSAVGYFFGRKLAKELGVTVGIIGCNWGGTSASAWMSRESLEEDRELRSYLEEYDRNNAEKTLEEQKEDYQEYITYQENWDKRVTLCYKENPKIKWNEVLDLCGPNRYPGPINSYSPFRPTGLYQCMLQRIMPYTLSGFIYYQGESDDHKPHFYQKLLTRLIRQWREDWEDDRLPFLFVQLPMHRYEADPDYKHWCLIREAQMRTYQTVKNTGIAVILDCGEFNEIHPKDKAPVGERLALQALYNVYERLEEEKAFGPIYKNFIYNNGGIELYFNYAEDGFIVQGHASGFEIAGEDKQYKKAHASIRNNTIFLKSEDVINPVYARYCWTNYGEVNIFGTNGIPLAPFRTSQKD
ncbi:MAG: sialate O-acetylesterase [Anaerolineaceae bacterium]|nr:MAG: sialate O-acetylesterase [Anaerolineaceae bacterium]